MAKCKICKPLFFEAANTFKIGKGVDFDNGSNLILREHANLGDYCLLDGKRGLITVGRHVMMGKYVIIICQNHKFLQDGGYNGFIGKDVIIDDYAWIGHRVTILPGVHIGKHAIIGAGSVVTKDIPDFAVAAGNPATVKKDRRES